jgi:hypothetical protein
MRKHTNTPTSGFCIIYAFDVNSSELSRAVETLERNVYILHIYVESRWNPQFFSQLKSIYIKKQQHNRSFTVKLVAVVWTKLCDRMVVTQYLMVEGKFPLHQQPVKWLNSEGNTVLLFKIVWTPHTVSTVLTVCYYHFTRDDKSE